MINGLLATKQAWIERAATSTTAAPAAAAAAAVTTVTTTSTGAISSNRATNTAANNHVPGAFRVRVQGDMDAEILEWDQPSSSTLLQTSSTNHHDVVAVVEARLVQDDRQTSQLGRDLEHAREEMENMRRREEEERNNIAVCIPIVEQDHNGSSNI